MSDLPDGGPQEPVDDGVTDDEQIIEDDEPVEDPAEPEGDEPAEPEPPAADQQQRRSRPGEVHRLRSRLENTERELAEMRGFREALNRQPAAPPPDPQAQLRALQARWSEMAPADAMAELWILGQQQIQQQVQQQQRLTDDRIDRRDYEAAARTSKVHRDRQPEVERLLAAARARGYYETTRNEVLAQLLGMELLDRVSRGESTQRAAAATRVARQQTRPAAARGDGARGAARPVAGSPEDDDRIIAEGFASGLRF